MLDPDRRLHRLAAQLGFGVVLIAAWYFIHAASHSVIPTPTAVVGALHVQVTNGILLITIIEALKAITVGFVLAIGIGIPLGLAMGNSELVEELFDPYVYALYVTPFAAMVPALIVWFGTGFLIRMVVVFFFSLVPITINTMQGSKRLPGDLIDAVQSFGGNRRFVLIHVILPYEVPFLVAGVRLGIGRAVKGLVVTELFVSVSGFGAILTKWSSAFRLEGVISVVLVLMLIGVLLTSIVRQIEKRVVHWNSPSTRTGL